MRRGLSLGAHLAGLDPGRARGRFHQRRLAVGKDAIQIHGLPKPRTPDIAVRMNAASTR